MDRRNKLLDGSIRNRRFEPEIALYLWPTKREIF